jgi:hypothetical protein
MNITYKFVVKKLKEDDRGYASLFICEMQGASDSGVKKNANIAVSFGGDDYRPIEDWTQEQIDAIAELHRENIELTIETQFNQGA